MVFNADLRSAAAHRAAAHVAGPWFHVRQEGQLKDLTGRRSVLVVSLKNISLRQN